MHRSANRPFSIVYALIAAFAGCCAAHADAPATNGHASVVKLVQTTQGFQLLYNGKPYFIKGAGGTGSKELLKQCGGNSFRTWGAGDLDKQFSEAERLGLTVTAGMWLGHKGDGFDYHNAAQVAKQLDDCKQVIARYKDAPPLLIWAIGNEMETGQPDDDPAVWQAVEDIARAAKQIDPNHPTMTVVAEIGGTKVAMINKYCPDIDIIGINSYGGAPSLGDRYPAKGGVKPYVLTEFGTLGTWEMGANAWGVQTEMTTTDKASWYRKAYDGAVAGHPLCLGSYVFNWGDMLDPTETWYSLMGPNGTHTTVVDTLTQIWTGAPPTHPGPVVRSLTTAGDTQVSAGATVHVSLDASSAGGAPITVDWSLQYDPRFQKSGVSLGKFAPHFPGAIANAGPTGADITLPQYSGGYLVEATVHNGTDSIGDANLPLLVSGDGPLPPPAVEKASIPLSIYGQGSDSSGYAASGYMGDIASIKMDAHCTDNPHSGSECLKVWVTGNSGWAGVVWQSPPNDWGKLAGGKDLTGATRLTFWARGDKGGEKVTFLYGLLKDSPFHDSSSAKLADVLLTSDWKQYVIDLTGKDLSLIKTPFCWELHHKNGPVTFYLDDIQYE